MQERLIRNIWAVGRNFSEHAAEMGEAIPKEPLFFLKAGSCVVPSGGKIHLPSFSQDIQYEVEIALQFNEHLLIDQVAIAIDLTARDIQSKLKAKGYPWTLAKSFKDACPLGPMFRIKRLEDLEGLSFHLEINGEVRQIGQVAEMLFSPTQLCNYVLNHFPVCPGDLILTGTPQGVSRAKSGDKVKAEMMNRTTAYWEVV